MKILDRLALIVIVFLSTSCATCNRSGIVIDTAGVDMKRYHLDLSE